jgi:uncharacterized protein (TIGR02145 family)
MKKILLLLITTISFTTIQAQNDSIYLWKEGQLIAQRSIKTVDLDSITFKRPINPNGINIAGPNVTDIDGNVYASVTNCTQTWTKQNLNVSKYSDGTLIPQVQNATAWANLTTGAWCYYNNDPANGAVYGKLYNWYAVAGIYDAVSLANPALRKKLAPTGWHIPTYTEWTQLTDCLGGEAVAGGKMKTTGTIQAGTGLWQDPNTGATNESGFSGLPAGTRAGSGGMLNVGLDGKWWSSSDLDSGNSGALYIFLGLNISTAIYDSFGKRVAISVRCVKDSSSNSNTTIIPLPPSQLNGTVANTEVTLTWTDNSTNETGFKIERKEGTGTYTLVGTTISDITTFYDIGLTPNTTYTYRVYSFNSVGNSSTYSNEIPLNTGSSAVLPILTTAPISSVTFQTASCGGAISSDGGVAIIARGVCWSTSPNPTIALSTKTFDNSGTGVFTSNLYELLPNTTYYVRAYATNSVGTAYGNEVSFTTIQNSTGINIAGPNLQDIDGNIYQSIKNCALTITKRNLNVSKYSDGTLIPYVTDPTQWANLSTGAWCYFNNDPTTEAIYGKLYNWYAVAGIYDTASAANPALRKKLAPTGWHIPTDAEWTQLTDCLGGTSVAGGKMKATGTIQSATGLWYEPNTLATNESGFTGLPGSSRNSNGSLTSTVSYGFGQWWSSSEDNSTNARNRFLLYNYGGSFIGSDNKRYGYSVRCLRD